jgi:hypothetical protein
MDGRWIDLISGTLCQPAPPVKQHGIYMVFWPVLHSYNTRCPSGKMLKIKANCSNPARKQFILFSCTDQGLFELVQVCKYIRGMGFCSYSDF